MDQSEMDQSEIEINYIEPQVSIEDVEASVIENRSASSQYLTNADYMNLESLKVYPNPTAGPFRIEMDMEIPVEAPSGMFFITITDQLGRVIQTKKVIKE